MTSNTKVKKIKISQDRRYIKIYMLLQKRAQSIVPSRKRSKKKSVQYRYTKSHYPPSPQSLDSLDSKRSTTKNKICPSSNYEKISNQKKKNVITLLPVLAF